MAYSLFSTPLAALTHEPSNLSDYAMPITVSMASQKLAARCREHMPTVAARKTVTEIKHHARGARN